MLRSLLVTALLGCQQRYSYELYQAEPTVIKEINVYVAADVDLSQDAVLRGCNLWNPEGITCTGAFNAPSARVEVHMYRGSGCRVDGELIVSWAEDYVITIYAECLYKVYGENFTDDDIAVIVAHETGHLLGLNHVPLDCQHPKHSLNENDQLPLDVNGKLICGAALMNTEPFMDFQGEIGMTTVDHRAYEVRTQSADIFGSVQL